jgi:hypothetical protein
MDFSARAFSSAGRPGRAIQLPRRARRKTLMMCAMAVRQIKPGSYEAFRKAWMHDPWLPRYDRALVLRNPDDDDHVMTIAFFDGTAEEYEAARDEPATMRAEEQRLHRIAEVEERVVLSGVYKLVEEVLPPGDGASEPWIAAS